MKWLKSCLIGLVLVALQSPALVFADVDELAQQWDMQKGVVKEYWIATKTVEVDGKRYKIPPEIEKGELHVSRGEWVEMDLQRLKPGDVILYKTEDAPSRNLQVIYRVVE